VPDSQELLRLPYIGQLRPSTLLGYLVSCAPPQLPSPFEVSTAAASTPQDMLVAYVDALTDTSFQSVAANHSNGPSVRRLYADQSGGWRSIPNELRAWELVQTSLDTFFQRISVSEGAQKQAMRQWYETIMDVGSKVMS
jgi:hypothetical protein